MEPFEEQQIILIKTELRRIETAIETASNDWDRHLAAARAVISSIDNTRLILQRNRADDQVFIISRLQRLAYYDADSGGVQDIADWCVTQWLSLLHVDPGSVEALRGKCFFSEHQSWLPMFHGQHHSLT